MSDRDSRRRSTNDPREVEREAFTIEEFCEAFRISRQTLYDAWKAKSGPRFKTVGPKGAKKIIPVAAAREWVNQSEVTA